MPHEDVMRAALSAFAERGYEGTSVRELSQQLGVSHNLLNQRYGRKDQLWREVVDHYFGSMNDTIAELAASAESGDTDPIDGFRAAIVTYVTANAYQPALLQLLNLESSVAGERLDYLFDRYIAFGAEDLGRLYRRLVRDGVVRAMPQETLYFVIAHAAAAPTAFAPLAAKFGILDTTTPEGIRRHAEAFADLFIDGIRLRPDATG